jgi:hypothetical protein
MMEAELLFNPSNAQPTTYAASTFLLLATHNRSSLTLLITIRLNMTDIQPMMLLRPTKLPSSEQSAPAAGQSSDNEEGAGGAEVHSKKNRRNPRQQKSDTRNESKRGGKERRGGEGGRKLATGDGDSGSDSDEQGNKKSDEGVKEHRGPLVDSRLTALQQNALVMEANSAIGCDWTSETPAAIQRRRVPEFGHISRYPQRVLATIFGNDAEASDT